MHPGQARRLRLERAEERGDLETLHAMDATAREHCGVAHQRETAAALRRAIARASNRRHYPDALGEPTGDPSPCENGDHPDVEGGRCLACGEWVIGPCDCFTFRGGG